MPRTGDNGIFLVTNFKLMARTKFMQMCVKQLLSVTTPESVY